MAKAKTYKGKSLRPGGGGRFQRMKDAIMRGNPSMSEEEASAIAAKQGRKQYGPQKMAKYAAQGRKRAAAKRKGKK